MTSTILLLAIGYGLVGAVLVLILFSTRVPLAIRGLATLFVAILVFTTYWGIGELRGLPSDAPPPERFRLHWARILEPNKLSGEKGSIFLWVEALDEDYYPSGLPRAYSLPYSLELAETVKAGLAAIADGEEIAGEISENAAELDTSERLAEEIANQGEGTNAVIGERVFQLDFGDISFDTLPAPVTPEKQP